MKLHKPEVAIESAGAKSSSRFSIEASQQAFAVLSSTIYEDKIKAPIRELSTNAYDAHVEAGCSDTPFEVPLPNAIEPMSYLGKPQGGHRAIVKIPMMYRFLVRSFRYRFFFCCF